MSSDALKSLLAGIEEVRDLQTANPTPPGGLPDRPRVVRAINRASVVLLSSHLERYLRGVNEEAVGVINAATISGSALPETLRLQHSKIPVDELAEAQWNNRAAMLSQLMATDGWLWGSGPKATLDHDRLLRWMKSPSPERTLRLFKLWGISDVFSAVTRQPHTRQRMWLKLEELVDKRNDIAHGDSGTEATYKGHRYLCRVVRTFCTRADGILSRTLASLCGRNSAVVGQCGLTSRQAGGRPRRLQHIREALQRFF